MSRTIRRGKPSRNFARYNRIGVIDHENRVYFSYRAGDFQQTWCEGDGKSYEEYAAREIRWFHSDFRSRRFSNVPRACRKADNDAQKAKHLQAIRVALSTGDYDVCLSVLEKFYSWRYY
ncbi:hypothetical protein [Pseudomonas serbica]|uniref:hypothetical protein n=1 Tax=Pseudomonas serbica TaxID=2965074 RepID=UPI00237B0993|nr:hypothetical protein [Pseudomonas serbica]